MKLTKMLREAFVRAALFAPRTVASLRSQRIDHHSLLAFKLSDQAAELQAEAVVLEKLAQFHLGMARDLMERSP